MNIVILMAGDDCLFKKAGWDYPKSLIEINDIPLIQHVIENITGSLKRDHRLICCIRQNENRTFHTGMVIKHVTANATIVEITHPTQGAACTALLAIDYINTEEPLLVVSGDQILDINLGDVIEQFDRDRLDGGIIVFKAIHPRWSYVRCDQKGLVIEVAEKKPISKLATAGVYYFRKGSDFVSSVVSMIKKGARDDGLFYVCPTYNEMILRQARVGIHEMNRDSYFSLKTPQAMESFEEHLKTVSDSVTGSDKSRKVYL